MEFFWLSDAYLVTRKADQWGQTGPLVLYATSHTTARRMAREYYGDDLDLCVPLESRKAVAFLGRNL